MQRLWKRLLPGVPFPVCGGPVGPDAEENNDVRRSDAMDPAVPPKQPPIGSR